jgi:hypothetical protein
MFLRSIWVLQKIEYYFKKLHLGSKFFLFFCKFSFCRSRFYHSLKLLITIGHFTVTVWTILSMVSWDLRLISPVLSRPHTFPMRTVTLVLSQNALVTTEASIQSLAWSFSNKLAVKKDWKQPSNNQVGWFKIWFVDAFLSIWLFETLFRCNSFHCSSIEAPWF